MRALKIDIIKIILNNYFHISPITNESIENRYYKNNFEQLFSYKPHHE